MINNALTTDRNSSNGNHSIVYLSILSRTPLTFVQYRHITRFVAIWKLPERRQRQRAMNNGACIIYYNTIRVGLLRAISSVSVCCSTAHQHYFRLLVPRLVETKQIKHIKTIRERQVQHNYINNMNAETSEKHR